MRGNKGPPQQTQFLYYYFSVVNKCITKTQAVKQREHLGAEVQHLTGIINNHICYGFINLCFALCSLIWRISTFHFILPAHKVTSHLSMAVVQLKSSH